MNNSSPTVIVTNFGFHSSPPSTTRQQPHLRHLLDVIQQSKETRVRAKMLPFSCRLMLAVCIWVDVALCREEISPTPRATHPKRFRSPHSRTKRKQDGDCNSKSCYHFESRLHCASVVIPAKWLWFSCGLFCSQRGKPRFPGRFVPIKTNVGENCSYL